MASAKVQHSTMLPGHLHAFCSTSLALTMCVCVSLSLSAVSVLAFTDPAQLYTVWQVDGESERDGAKIETEQ